MAVAEALKEIQDRKRHAELIAKGDENHAATLSELALKAKELLTELKVVGERINALGTLSDAQTSHLDVTSAMVRDVVVAAKNEILSKPQKEVDLTPLVEAIASIPALPDLSPLVELAKREDAKDTWVFDVKRDQRGFITEVTAH